MANSVHHRQSKGESMNRTQFFIAVRAFILAHAPEAQTRADTLMLHVGLYYFTITRRAKSAGLVAVLDGEQVIAREGAEGSVSYWDEEACRAACVALGSENDRLRAIAAKRKLIGGE